MNSSPSPNALSPSEGALPPVTTNLSDQFTNDLNRLSLTAASTTLPASPAVGTPPQKRQNLSPGAANRFQNPSPNDSRQPPSPLRRSSSSMSSNGRSSTPTLLRKSSMNSVQSPTSPRISTGRRISGSQYANGLAQMSKSPLSSLGEDSVPPKPQATAASIASAHFKTELDVLHTDEGGAGRAADTIVILHDSCYGHRFSRPKTSRAALSTIVERPERIHASILGVSAAYVRLGERHAEGRNDLHPTKDPAKLSSIPFRIRKTTRRMALSSPAVTNVHGSKWMDELKIMCEGAEGKLALNEKELTRPEMVRSPTQGEVRKFHEGDLYLCSESLEAMEGALGAVCEGVDAVFNGSTSGQGPRKAFVAIRPPGHHCSSSYPSGFCWLNNVHVGISHAALAHGLTHAAMIDFDLHHGDGSQAIAWEHNTRASSLPKNAAAWKKTSIGYFSLHDINSYPCEMGDEEKVKNASLCIENAHGQSIWNVHLQPWKSSQEFWELYETKYSVLLEKTRNFLHAQTQRINAIPNGPRPKAVIFLSSGFDASEWESSGMQRHKVNVPTDFYARITRDVVKLAAEEGCSVDGRVVSVLEGGYSNRALSSGVLSHISGLAGSDPVLIKKDTPRNGVQSESKQKAPMNPAESIDLARGAREYDPEWWALHHLEALDRTVYGPPPPPEPKKGRDIPASHYSSPTHSFVAKVVDLPTYQRSSSKLSVNPSGSPRAVSRGPTPPPPEVDWTVAAHELSKLLIPVDRQTMSCKPEDLAAVATRARRERQSILTSPIEQSMVISQATTPSTRMGLRDRKAKLLMTTEEGDETEKPKATRKKQPAGGAVVAAAKALSRSSTPRSEAGYDQAAQLSARRLSTSSVAASTVSSGAVHASRLPSNSTSAMSVRVGSAMSIRPDSSMSSRGQSIPVSASLPVKKTRQPAVATKTVRAKKSEVQEPKSGTAANAQVSSALPTDTTASGDNELDALTTGMKKITITLMTKAQREAREREAQQQGKDVKAKVAAKTSRSPKKTAVVAGKVVTPPLAVSEKIEMSATPVKPLQVPEIPESPLPTPGPAVPPHDPATISHATVTPSTPLTDSSTTEFFTPAPVSLPSSIPSTPQTPLPSAPSPPDTGATGGSSNIFIPYQPEGPPPSLVEHIKQEPLKWLPPNTNTPVATRITKKDVEKKGAAVKEMEVSEAPAVVDKQEGDRQKEAQAVEEKSSIHQNTGLTGARPAMGAHARVGSGVGKGQLPVWSSTGAIPFGAPDVGSKEEKKDNHSIWDIPETPQK